jgi:hypothetical protein
MFVHNSPAATPAVAVPEEQAGKIKHPERLEPQGRIRLNNRLAKPETKMLPNTTLYSCKSQHTAKAVLTQLNRIGCSKVLLSAMQTRQDHGKQSIAVIQITPSWIQN